MCKSGDAMLSWVKDGGTRTLLMECCALDTATARINNSFIMLMFSKKANANIGGICQIVWSRGCWQLFAPRTRREQHDTRRHDTTSTRQRHQHQMRAVEWNTVYAKHPYIFPPGQWLPADLYLYLQSGLLSIRTHSNFQFETDSYWNIIFTSTLAWLTSLKCCCIAAIKYFSYCLLWSSCRCPPPPPPPPPSPTTTNGKH